MAGYYPRSFLIFVFILKRAKEEGLVNNPNVCRNERLPLEEKRAARHS